MTYRFLVGLLVVSQAAAAADAPPGQLPAVSLKPFAAPPPVIKGPDAPAAPMEKEAPTLAKAVNGSAVLEQVGVVLTPEQRKFLDTERFLLLTLEGTDLETHFEAPPPAKDENGEPQLDYRSTRDEMLKAFFDISGPTDTPYNRMPGAAKLINPDLVLHAYHRYFSNAMEFIEQRQLRARLETFLATAMGNASALRKTASGPRAERLEWIEAQLAAAWVVLGRESKYEKPADEETPPPEVAAAMARANPPTDPRTVAQRLADKAKELSPRAGTALKEEVALIIGAAGMESSPLFGFYDPEKRADYSQFQPRSHYTKTEELKGYFRAMMFLGRNGYSLGKAGAPNAGGITDAVLLAHVLGQPAGKGKGKSALALWQDIMEITGFFAGQSDDLTYPEFRAWSGAALAQKGGSLDDAVSADAIARLGGALDKLRLPEIVSSAHVTEDSPAADPVALRIFGQRFTYDAWVFTQLTRGKISMPTGAFVPAAFGDPAALGFAKSYVESLPLVPQEERDAFPKALASLRETLASVPDADWFSSMGAKQLHAATRLARATGPNFPHYMRSPMFAGKNIESMLGSWTELKHDTVLYAKQNYAEMGEGGDTDKPPPPPPYGFIQPDLSFWREMERLARFTADGFVKHDLLPDAKEVDSKLQRFAKDMANCRRIAEKEASGKALTPAERDIIWQFDLLYMDEPFDQMEVPDPNRGKTALITDVHTDAYQNMILLEALGRPCVMLALVGNENKPRLVAGVAYRHYEFTGPLPERPTDESWRAKVYVENPKLPERNAWAAPVFKSVPKPKKEE